MDSAEKQQVIRLRNDRIYESWSKGRSLKDLAEEHSVTAGRIREIISRGKYKHGLCFNFLCELPAHGGKIFCERHLPAPRSINVLGMNQRRLDMSYLKKPDRVS